MRGDGVTLLVAGLLTVLVAALAVLTVERWLPWRLLTRRRVIVNLVDGSSFAGVLWARRGRLLVLRQAVYHERDRQAPVDGDVVVERARVAWLQVIPAGDGS